jgi:hypothetical protein
MSKSKKRKAAQRPRASVFLGGKKIGEVESVTTKPIRMHAGRHRIIVKTTHDVDGSPAGESCSHVDQVTHIMADDKYKLAERLRELASVIANTESDFDGGTTCIIVGRRYSSAALKRLRGE